MFWCVCGELGLVWASLNRETVSWKQSVFPILPSQQRFWTLKAENHDLYKKSLLELPQIGIGLRWQRWISFTCAAIFEFLIFTCSSFIAPTICFALVTTTLGFLEKGFLPVCSESPWLFISFYSNNAGGWRCFRILFVRTTFTSVFVTKLHFWCSILLEKCFGLMATKLDYLWAVYHKNQRFCLSVFKIRCV